MTEQSDAKVENLEEVFNSAVSVVHNLPKDGPVKPSNDMKLKFYAYFKQATEGPNTNPKPSYILSPTNWYKWDIWQKLGDLTKMEAMLAYIEELRKSMEDANKDGSTTEPVELLPEGEKFLEYCKKKGSNISAIIV